MQKPKIEIESGGKEIIFSSCIQPFSLEDNKFEIKISTLYYEFVFVDDKDINAKPNLKITDLVGKRGWKLLFKNYKNSIGITNTKAINIGYVSNHDIFLNYSVYDINGNKSVFITLYMDKGERQNG